MEDYQQPLNPKTTLPHILVTTKTKVKELPVKLQRKKHVMSAMDTFLTLFVVAPLIVGQWRGTWELMSIYSRFFPAWESFIFGGALHLSFAIIKDGLQELINFEKKTWRNIAVGYILRRIYTYLFAAACIMNWRGGWEIFDRLLEIEAQPNGRSLPGKHLPITIGILITSAIILALSRCCRNILAAPFVIGLDTKSTAFDFPTRFRKTISYTALYAVNNKAIKDISDQNASNPTAEKLVASQVTVEKQVVEQISPRPFVNDLRGALPTGFFPHFGTATTTSFPQIANHRSPAHPHNIQDIIQYLSENAHRQKELIREEQRFATTKRERDKYQLFGTIHNPRTPQGYNHESYGSQQSFNKHLPQDPFFAYKPQDPSDINLLAPTSFRFAPAILSSSFYRNRQKLIQEATQAANETSNEGLLKKPLTLTLNIYPSPYDNNVFVNRDRFQGPGITPRYRYPFPGGQRATNILNPGRMVVHLNVYPGAGHNVSNSEEFSERRFQQRRRSSQGE